MRHISTFIFNAGLICVVFGMIAGLFIVDNERHGPYTQIAILKFVYYGTWIMLGDIVIDAIFSWHVPS